MAQKHYVHVRKPTKCENKSLKGLGFKSFMLKIYKQSYSMKYEVFTAELLKIQSLWFVTPCLLVNSYQPFQRLQHLQNVWNYLPIITVKHPRRPRSPTLLLCFTQKLSCNSCPQDLCLEWQYYNRAQQRKMHHQRKT